MDYSRSERCWVWLSSVKGMTPRKFYKLLSVAEAPENVFDCPDEFKSYVDEKLYKEIAKPDEGELDKLFEQLEKSGVSAIVRSSEMYPNELNYISDPPPTLFMKGSLDLNSVSKPFAIVGTRMATYDGKKAAREFARDLTYGGAAIVSGLARGIDTIAHTACLEAGGKTIAVLGNGLAGIYPPENAELAQKIIDGGGCLLSELRLDEAPSRWSFPARNRIIAGLCHGVLVVEGRATSGSLITANYALDYGKEVFAVPGGIYNALAAGPNGLIQNGAHCALNPLDVLETMHWVESSTKKQPKETVPEMDTNEKRIYDFVKNECKSFDELLNLTGFSVSELNCHLTMLLLRSIIIKLPGNLYRAA